MKRSRNQSKCCKPQAPHNLILEEIIGLTTKDGNGLASNISSSKCAYVAGCVVVIHDVLSGTQSHVTSPNRVPKPLSCVALSHNASIVAAGESGHQTSILVWDCTTLAFICELKCHSYGVACMAVSADGKYLVSAGFPHDGYICLWDWQNKILAAKVKASSVSFPIASIEFSFDNKFIITADKNQLKFWKVRWPPGSRASTRSVSLTMLKKVDLGPKESSFLAVTSSRWMSSSSVNHIQTVEQTPFYAVTGRGTLCMVYTGSPVIKMAELEVEKCFAISTSTSLVACACNNGLVKLFGTISLKYAGELCYVETRCKGSTDLDYHGHHLPTLPDAIACQFSTSEKLVVVYDDHSLYIWNIHDIHKATRCCVLVSHSGCIWDIKNVPCENMHDPSLSCAAKGCFGGLSFATCSTDGNIRLWDLALQSTLSENSSSLTSDGSSNGAMCLVSAGIFERESVAEGISSPGFRAMAVSSDGKHLAAGDCQGNIHIFNLYSSDYIFIKDAHAAEILSLSFNLADNNDFTSAEASESHHFLASGGRDGKIHLFDVDRNFNLCGSINYHSSAVTVVKVAQSGREILSCAADRSMVLHSVDVSETECKTSCLRSIATPGTIYDVAIDHPMDIAFTVGKEKKINTFDIQSGKLIRWFQHDGGGGDPIKVATDGSHSYLACSYSNRCICIYDYVTGEMVAQGTGHSELVTGVIFLPDCQHLVSVGADGCIFVWKLPALISSRMLRKTKDISVKFPQESMNQHMYSNQIKSDQVKNHQYKGSNNESPIDKDGCSSKNAVFRFSISRLPEWARYQVMNSSPPMDIESTSSEVHQLNDDNVGLQQDYACLEPQSPSKENSEVGPQVSGTLSRSISETESKQVSPSPPQRYQVMNSSPPMDIESTSSEVHQLNDDNVGLQQDYACLELQSPSKENSEVGPQVSGTLSRSISETESKQVSPSPPQTDSWASNNRWLTIHTVCMDLFDSPNSCDMKGLNMQGLATDIGCTSHNHVMETNHASKRIKLSYAEKCCSTSNPMTDKYVDASGEDSQVHENFRMNFGNLSAEPKTEEGKSLSRSNYTSRFLVRREVLQGRKRSLSSFSPIKPSNTLLEDARNAGPSSFKLDDDIPTIDLSKPPLNTKLVKIEVDEAQQLDVKRAENVRSCEEAIRDLETAAENALQCLCKLETMNIGEEKSKSLEFQLYAKGALMLPSIESKIQAIAKLLQPSSSK